MWNWRSNRTFSTTFGAIATIGSEHLTVNQGVVGSSPTCPAKSKSVIVTKDKSLCKVFAATVTGEMENFYSLTCKDFGLFLVL